MGEELKIRPANNLDISELLRLGWEAFKELEWATLKIEYNVGAVSKQYLDVIESNGSKGIIYVAEHPTKERKLIGLINVIRQGMFHNPNYEIGHVIQTIVDKKFRGSGLGKKLLKEIEEWALSIGVEMIIIHSHKEAGRNIRNQFAEEGFKQLEAAYYKLLGDE